MLWIWRCMWGMKSIKCKFHSLACATHTQLCFSLYISMCAAYVCVCVRVFESLRLLFKYSHIELLSIFQRTKVMKHWKHPRSRIRYCIHLGAHTFFPFWSVSLTAWRHFCVIVLIKIHLWQKFTYDFSISIKACSAQHTHTLTSTYVYTAKYVRAYFRAYFARHTPHSWRKVMCARFPHLLQHWKSKN